MSTDTPAAAPITAEREAFEEWIKSPPYEHETNRFPEDEDKFAWPGEYRDITVALAWEAWQARAALSAPVAAQPAQAQAAGVPDEMRAQGWSQADMSQQQFSKYGPQLRPDDLAGADEGRDEAVAKVRQMQQAMKSPLGHGAPDWNRANYKPLCEGGPLYVRGECGDCDSRAAVVFGGALLAVSGVDALWVERLRQTAVHLRENSLSLAKYPGMGNEARARELAALYIGEIAELYAARTHLSTALTGAAKE